MIRLGEWRFVRCKAREINCVGLDTRTPSLIGQKRIKNALSKGICHIVIFVSSNLCVRRKCSNHGFLAILETSRCAASKPSQVRSISSTPFSLTVVGKLSRLLLADTTVTSPSLASSAKALPRSWVRSRLMPASCLIARAAASRSY